MITIIWESHPQQFASAFTSWARSVKKFDEPFQRSVKEVMAPSLSENFKSGGRPSWAPLAAYTVDKKGGGQILVETGKLRDVAGSPGSWSMSNDSIELTDVPQYGRYQDTGFYNVPFDTHVPSRQWALYQPGDIDGVEDVFVEWVEQKYEDSFNDV